MYTSLIHIEEQPRCVQSLLSVGSVVNQTLFYIAQLCTVKRDLYSREVPLDYTYSVEIRNHSIFIYDTFKLSTQYYLHYTDN